MRCYRPSPLSSVCRSAVKGGSFFQIFGGTVGKIDEEHATIGNSRVDFHTV